MDYLDYLPPRLKDFVEETLDNGTDVIEDLREDVEKEIISKTSGNFESISENLGKVVQGFNELKEKNDEICKD